MKDRSKHLLRLALADQAFREAMAMAKHIPSAKLKVGDHIYHAAIAGLIISYCRPFMSATGLGRISPDFEIFKNTSHPEFFTAIHTDLMMTRDKVVAHFDLEYGMGQYTSKTYALHPGEVGLSLKRRGFELHTNHTTLTQSRLQDAKKLISLQIERVKQAQTDFVMSLINSGEAKLGNYVFSPTPTGGPR